MTRTTFFSVIVVATVTAAGCRTPNSDHSDSQITLSSVPPADRLYAAALVLLKLERVYVEEIQRLERLCSPRPSEDTCRSRKVSPQRHRLATLYSRPDRGSPPAAFINARPYFRESDLLLALDLEFADRPGAFVPWIPVIGDGPVHIDGRVRVEGDWVQLMDPVIRVPAWAPKEVQDWNVELYTHVDSIAGGIFHLQPLEATNPSGARQVIAAGDFIVTRVSQDMVEFRLEVESDNGCGDDIPAPPVMPPLLRATPSEFFDAEGTPRFTTKYTRGC